MRIMYIYSYILIFSLFFFTSCHKIEKKKIHKQTITCEYNPVLLDQNSFNKQNNPKKSPPIVTIWIHGTRAFFSKFIAKNFFYTKPGLHCATTFEQKYHIREMAEILSTLDPANFSVENIYFYGWSGKLSFKARLQAAKKLYIYIKDLIKAYENEYGIKPIIRIITHSHGGNVALNLVQYNKRCKIIIDELILIACPVQKRTSNFSKSPMFKNVYSLYSRHDSIQILDPQVLYWWFKKDLSKPYSIKPDNFFSQRCFPEQENIRQVQIMFPYRGIMHIEFITNKFIAALPLILEEIRKWQHNAYSMINQIVVKLA